MKVIKTAAEPQQVEADAVVIGVYADQELNRHAGAVNRATNGALDRLKQLGEWTGKPHQTVSLWCQAGCKSPMVLVVGLGERSRLSRGVAYRAAATASGILAGKARGKVAFFLDDDWPAELSEAGIAGALAACHGQDLYKAVRARFPFAEMQWSASNESSLQRGQILGEAINLTRLLVNEPAQEIYPESFANKAQEVAAECGIECEIWDQARLEREECGSLLAVAKGSQRPPRLVILRYRGNQAPDPAIAFVGKGVTFDSGGLSLKPSDSMLSMKCDMAGAATVLGAMQAIAKLKLPVHVVGLMGLVENMTGGAAMKLGDVLTARSGVTIEVHNTDAEGRLVLADVLNVATGERPAKIVDLATLTGACMVALGRDVCGAMSNDKPWCDAVLDAAAVCGERLWQLPMFEEYAEHIKSDVADIKNVGDGRWGGAITAAKFLEEFVGGLPWVHLDIAGPAFCEKPKPWQEGGATGAFVRTLVELARRAGT